MILGINTSPRGKGSNSLWALEQALAEIEGENFIVPYDSVVNFSGIKGIIVSGPVYFGDRGSIAEEVLQSNFPPGLLYAGIATGAKRNGGQETQLIYQMWDYLNLGFLAIGNDSQSTAQYGGTMVAGNKNTAHLDTYGLETVKGVGRRMNQVLKLRKEGPLIKPKVLFLILQDKGIRGRETSMLLRKFINRFDTEMEHTVIEMTKIDIKPCIACNECPTPEHRCIVKDKMYDMHDEFLGYDAIVPVVHAHYDRTVYQAFMERSRYLRRDDYQLSNQIIAPLVFEEQGSRTNIALRLMTSFIRHHTIMSRPMICHLTKRGATTDLLDNFIDFENFLKNVSLYATKEQTSTPYQNIGYQ